jgi:hypothetical protein
MKIRYFALVYGIAFLLTGIAGFVPGLLHNHDAENHGLTVTAGFGYLFGLFPVNVLHNVVHLLIGILGLVAFSGVIPARRYAQGVAIFYGVLTLLGLLPYGNTLFGLVPIFGYDILLHGAAAAVAAYFGFMWKDADTPSRKTMAAV